MNWEAPSVLRRGSSQSKIVLWQPNKKLEDILPTGFS
jgi:hypothetical protein